MRTILASLLLITFTSVVYGDDNPLVVVELYTSEGCSSCPPADDLLGQFAQEQDVLALSLHVDYWDYLGWKDKYAMAKFTKRQETYNSVIKSRYRLVTPQMVFQGQKQVAGAMPKSVRKMKKYLAELRAKSDVVNLNVTQSSTDHFRVTISPRDVVVPVADVFVIYYTPKQSSNVKKGENRGRQLDHTNVVTLWKRIGQWKGQRDWQVEHDLPANTHAAVIVQAQGNGPILAARRLR